MAEAAGKSVEAGLRDGLGVLGLSLTDGQIGQLLGYLDLIAKWTKVYNLTSVRDPQDMLTHHLLDSLAIIAPLRRHTGGRSADLLDVGAGAGLPGVVIAICCPSWKSRASTPWPRRPPSYSRWPPASGCPT